MQSERGRQHQVRAVRLQQIGRADIGPEARGDQGDHIHQRVGGLAALLGEFGDLLHRQDMVGVLGFIRLGHRFSLVIFLETEH